MGCILTLLALMAPRVVMACIWIMTDWFVCAYETTVWPVLGFIFMPYTSLAYMAAMLHNDHRVSGLWILLLIVAILADLSSEGKAGRSGTKKRRAGKAEPGG